MAVRDIKSGKKAQQDIITESANPNVHVRYLNLNSISSIIDFSDNILLEFDEIYALVNNAGVFYYPQELTEDGFDVTLQTNYLGPYVLTHCLLSALKNSEHSRVINVCSEAHRYANEYDLKVILHNQADPRNNFISYGATKLALLLFTKELARKLISKLKLYFRYNQYKYRYSSFNGQVQFPRLGRRMKFIYLINIGNKFQ